MRPDTNHYFLEIAAVVATRSTCLRRHVGCVLVDNRNHILATGYNGVPSGMPHCNKYDQFDAIGYPFACDGASAKSGEKLDACMAIHAEANALLQCPDVYAIETAYCTTMPCVHCIKLLLNTSCKRIVYIEDYPHSEAKQLWLTQGRSLLQLDIRRV